MFRDGALALGSVHEVCFLSTLMGLTNPLACSTTNEEGREGKGREGEGRREVESRINLCFHRNGHGVQKERYLKRANLCVFLILFSFPPLAWLKWLSALWPSNRTFKLHQFSNCTRPKYLGAQKKNY